MSSLTSLISGGGGGGSLVEGLITSNTITGNTTITCPSGKYIRVLALFQSYASQSGSNSITLTLSFGSRTVLNNKTLDDQSPYMFYGYTKFSSGPSSGGTPLAPSLTGKKDENLVISGYSRVGSLAQTTVVYAVMEDA